MPLVRVTLRKGRSAEYLKELGESIHQALVAHANVPPDDCFQIVHEVEGAHMTAHPSYAGMVRSEQPVFIEITLNAGRTLEVKRALYAGIVSRLQAAIGVRPDDVLINLVEVSRENWSFGGGLATYAVE
jgi:4-oxalocrotonate tautomerase